MYCVPSKLKGCPALVLFQMTPIKIRFNGRGSSEITDVARMIIEKGEIVKLNGELVAAPVGKHIQTFYGIEEPGSSGKETDESSNLYLPDSVISIENPSLLFV